MIENVYNEGMLESALQGSVIFLVMFLIGMGLMLILGIVYFISLAKIFKKAGKPAIAAIIPIYNIVVVLQIANMPLINLLLMLVPILNIYVIFKVWNNIAHNFGKSTGYALGLFLLSIVFIPHLAFSDSTYSGSENGNTSKENNNNQNLNNQTQNVSSMPESAQLVQTPSDNNIVDNVAITGVPGAMTMSSNEEVGIAPSLEQPTQDVNTNVVDSAQMQQNVVDNNNTNVAPTLSTAENVNAFEHAPLDIQTVPTDNNIVNSVPSLEETSSAVNVNSLDTNPNPAENINAFQQTPTPEMTQTNNIIEPSIEQAPIDIQTVPTDNNIVNSVPSLDETNSAVNVNSLDANQNTVPNVETNPNPVETVNAFNQVPMMDNSTQNSTSPETIENIVPEAPIQPVNITEIPDLSQNPVPVINDQVQNNADINTPSDVTSQNSNGTNLNMDIPNVASPGDKVCKNCGTPMPGIVTICPNCGTENE